jgi:hypothetical protein
VEVICAHIEVEAILDVRDNVQVSSIETFGVSLAIEAESDEQNAETQVSYE